MLAFALMTLIGVSAPPSPGGLELPACTDEGGTYFFADGVAIDVEGGCGPGNVRVGRWRHEGDAIVVSWERWWSSKGSGRRTGVADCGDTFESYAATRRNAPDAGEDNRFAADLFQVPPEDCGAPVPHHRPEDPHAFLRLFDGDHPETFQRVLRPEELVTRSPEELRQMRNEIFARYGLRFRDPTLRARFEKRLGGRGLMVDVDAWLSEIERSNVEVLAAAEQRARKP